MRSILNLTALYKRSGHWRQRLTVLLLLGLGLLNGALYTFIVPPWQHYDEPSHFEYAWLIANRPDLPQPGDYDRTMRRDVVASMLAHGFYYGMGVEVDLQKIDVPEIGYTQLFDPPLYYILAALPMRLLHGKDVTAQLYAARLVSLVLFLISILAAWGVVAELTPTGHPLRWMVSATLALLPAFANHMTAMNNDAGTVACMSLFLWGAVRMLQRGFSLPRLIGCLLAAGLCFYMNKIGAIAFALLVVAVILSVPWKRVRRVARGAMVAGAAGLMVLLFFWGDAAAWYRLTPQASPTRTEQPQSPVGAYALQLEVVPGGPAPALIQLIPTAIYSPGQTQTLTLGAWMWASASMPANLPAFQILNDGVTTRNVEVGTTPSFHAITVSVPAGVVRTWVTLSPILDTSQLSVTTTVFYSGLVLADGERPTQEAPRFDDATGEAGVWGGRPFRNVLRNPFANQSWPWLYPWAETLLKRYLPVAGWPTLTLYTLLDGPGAAWYYSTTARVMFQTFWARFGWGHVPVLDERIYTILIAITLAGLAGAIPALWLWWRKLPLDALILLGVALLVVWIMAVTRGAAELLWSSYISQARYAFPVIIPTALLLNAGWLGLFRLVQLRARISNRVIYAVHFVFLLALDLVSLLSIVQFYAGRS